MDDLPVQKSLVRDETEETLKTNQVATVPVVQEVYKHLAFPPSSAFVQTPLATRQVPPSAHRARSEATGRR